jgi:epoxyqueuosine reductase
MTPAQNTEAIRDKALALGFHKVGFAPAADADPERRLRAWLDRGFHGGLDYMARNAAQRADPRLYVEGARSVVALAMSYYDPGYRPNEPLKVSRYAVSDDYHALLKKRARKLRRFMLTLDPNAKVAPTVDTSPVLERAWAERTGIAWIGKSTMAIACDLGTYTFLATLITTMELAYDEPHPDRCGSCTACLDACPTNAFAGPYQLDARRCITYWNIETRDPFPASGPGVDLHGWVAGCDVCQEVCPWNKFAKPHAEPRLRPHESLASPDPTTFRDPGENERLRALLDGTTLARTGAPAIRRNTLAILRD